MPTLLVLVLALALTPSTGAQAQTAPADLPANRVTGQSNKNPLTTDPGTLYQQYCSVCHGEKGDGQSRARRSLSPPPVDFTDAAQVPRLTRDRMISAVTFGVPGTAMVGWRTQLDDGQIGAIVDFVRTSFVTPQPAVARPAMPITAPPVRQAAAHPTRPAAVQAADQVAAQTTHARPDSPAHRYPGNLSGDPNRGGPLYMNNCLACHGALGDGDGPRAYFINPPPRNFQTTQARSTFSQPALFAAIAHGRPGTEMPAWKQVLTDQQIADVAEYVFRQYLSAP